MKRRGYEVRCSQAMVKKLGAWFGAYHGRNVLHWDSGYLWWIT